MIPFTAAPSPVSMSAGVKSSTYTVALTGKTFDVLSSMLYKDPHLAIVRELSCNAYDSHVEHGCLDKAFDIHLPNVMEPYFAIRDYGTGMSAEAIDNVYTKFFESTKTTSNDVVGALGLGSKSPFSYTSNYTITSWHGGLKLVYSAFKTSDGIPSIALLDVSDSTEPTGLEVNFAVKAADFEKFTSKVQSFFTTWGSTPPNILGGLQGRTNLRHVERDFGGTDWFVAKADGPLNSALAIQGNVPYPLNRNTITGSNAFRERFTTEQQRSLVTQLLALPIIITFPIGSLDFSASREELQYTEQTVAVILDKLVKIGEGIKQHIQDQFAALPTMWDVVKFCRSLRHDRLRNIVQYANAGKLDWKGQTITIDQQSVKVDQAKVTAALAIHDLQVQTNKRRKMEAYPLRMSKIDKVTLPDGTQTTTAVEVVSEHLSFSPKTDAVTIVIFDEAKGCTAKLKHHYLDKINSSSYGEVITVSIPRGTKLTNPKAFKAAAAALMDAFQVPGSYVTVVFSSDLAAPPAKGRRAPTGDRIDDTFKVFDPSVKNDNCPDKYSTTAWSVISDAEITSAFASGKYKHIVFVPQIRGVPQFMYTNKVGDVVFNEFADDFPSLWNTLRSVTGNNRVLLVGVKSSAMDGKRFKAFAQKAQSLEAFVRFWMYENAAAMSQSDAYHLEWTNNYGKQNIVLRAVAAITDSKHKTVASTSTLVNKFICDDTAQQRAHAHSAMIQLMFRLLRNIDRARGADADTILDEISQKVDKSAATARAEYANLKAAFDKLTKEFPMLDYVNQAFRYSGSAHDIKRACDQIVTYVKLASV